MWYQSRWRLSRCAIFVFEGTAASGVGIIIMTLLPIDFIRSQKAINAASPVSPTSFWRMG